MWAEKLSGKIRSRFYGGANRDLSTLWESTNHIRLGPVTPPAN